MGNTIMNETEVTNHRAQPKRLRIGINALGAISKDTGGQTYLANFIRTCVELQLPHEYFIFYSGPPEDIWGDLPNNFHKLIIPGTARSGVSKVFGEQFLLPLWIIGRRLDVFYFPGNFVSFLLGKPMVVAIRSLLDDYFPQAVPRSRRYYRKVFRWLTTRRAARILVPSALTAREVVRLLGVPSDKVTVVPHGVNHQVFANRPSTEAVTQQLQAMGVQRPYFLFVSALWPYKGAENFIAAVQQIRARTGRQDITGVMAGKGIAADAFLKQLQKQINDSGLQDAIHLVGNRPHNELAALYWGAEALVFPSYCESFGNPLVEAMAAGTPIIASNRHAVPDTVGPAGIIIDPDDGEQIVTAMHRLLTEPDLRAELIALGRQRSEQFKWPQSVQSALKVFEKAAALPAQG